MAVSIGGSSGSILTTTWANKPATYPTGWPVFITNAGAQGSHWVYDGTRWKPHNGTCTLATLDSATGNITNTESIVLQCLMPAGLWQTGDRLRIYAGLTKSGTTDTGNIFVHCGTAGTTGDTNVVATNGIISTARQQGVTFDVRLESATSALMMASTRQPIGYAGGSVTAYDAAVAISSASANALYVSVGIKSTGATDTVQAADVQIQLISKAN